MIDDHTQVVDVTLSVNDVFMQRCKNVLGHILARTAFLFIVVEYYVIILVFVRMCICNENILFWLLFPLLLSQIFILGWTFSHYLFVLPIRQVLIYELHSVSMIFCISLEINSTNLQYNIISLSLIRHIINVHGTFQEVKSHANCTLKSRVLI